MMKPHISSNSVAGLFGIALVGLVTAYPAEAQPPTKSTRDARVDELIRKLGSDEYVVRERASQALADLGLDALDALAQAQYDDDVEIAVRARRLLLSIQVRWITDTDPADVRQILEHYGRLPPGQRASVLDRLSALHHAGALVALARIARYDPSPQVSRLAALHFLRAKAPAEPERHKVRQTVKRLVGRSQRTSAQWLRMGLALWEHPEQAIDMWSKIVDQEWSTYLAHPQQNGPEVLRALLLSHVEVLLHHDRRQEAHQVAERILPLLSDDSAQLIEMADWLLEREWPDLIETLYARFHDAFHQNTVLMFRLAESRRKSGDEEHAREAARQALQQVARNGPHAVWLLGISLENDGFFHWAEMAYRELTDVPKPDYKEHASVFISLAEMLHDLKRDDEAAKALQKLVQAGAERPLKAAIERETRQTIDRLAARAAFFEACHYGATGNREAQAEALRRSLSLSPIDSDTLILLYRWAQHDAGELLVARQKIAEAVAKYRQMIEATKTKIRESRSRLERLQTEIDLAQQCNQVAWLISNTEGDYQFALQCALEAHRLYPDSAGIRDTLARCYFATGQVERAIQEQRAALEQDPHSPPLKAQLEMFLKHREKASSKAP